MTLVKTNSSEGFIVSLNFDFSNLVKKNITSTYIVYTFEKMVNMEGSNVNENTLKRKNILHWKL